MGVSRVVGRSILRRMFQDTRLWHCPAIFVLAWEVLSDIGIGAPPSSNGYCSDTRLGWCLSGGLHLEGSTVLEYCVHFSRCGFRRIVDSVSKRAWIEGCVQA